MNLHKICRGETATKVFCNDWTARNLQNKTSGAAFILDIGPNYAILIKTKKKTLNRVQTDLPN